MVINRRCHGSSCTLKERLIFFVKMLRDLKMMMRSIVICGLFLSVLSLNSSAEATPLTEPTLSKLSTSLLNLGSRVCVRCHAAVSEQWSRSSHRHASLSNPYYAAAARVHFEKRGGEGEGSILFCARCHDPALIKRSNDGVDQVPIFKVTSMLSADRDPARAGVGCLLCHSMKRTPDPRGNGKYHLDLDPLVLRGDDHRQRFTSPLSRSSKLCATCHKVSLSEEITQHQWLRGQDDADQWSQSAWAGLDPLRPLAEPKPYTPCQGCHMPLTKSDLSDRAADAQGRVRSHAFLGANASVAAWIGAERHVRQTARFVHDAVTLWLRESSALSSVNFGEYPDGDDRDVTLDLIALNVGAGHRIPAGVNDTNEMWLEVLAWDEQGHLISHSGLLPELSPPPPYLIPNTPPDLPPVTRSARPPSAHIFRVQAVDDQGDPLARRDVTAQRSFVFDTSLHPFEPRLIRLSLPAHAHLVSARVLMRQFERPYLTFACASLSPDQSPDDHEAHTRCTSQPTLEVARVMWSRDRVVDRRYDEHRLPSWPDALVHLIALSRGEPEYVREADELWSSLPARLRLSARGLIARLSIDVALGRTDQVIHTSRSLWSPPYRLPSDQHPARHWLEAKALMNAFRTRLAVLPLKTLRVLAPHHRIVTRAMSAAWGALAQPRRSLQAAQALLKLDSESAEGWRLSLLALRALDAPVEERDQAERRWLSLRFDDERHAALRRSWQTSTDQRQVHLLSAIPHYNIELMPSD